MIQIFINEASYCSQYRCHDDLCDALRLFISSLKKICEIKKDKSVLQSRDLFCYSETYATPALDSILKSKRDLRFALKDNLQKLNPKYWQVNRMHKDDCKYVFSGKDYVRTSVAELAERKLQVGSLDGFLINFIGSPFGDSATIDVLKNDAVPINIDCTTTPESIEQWLTAHGFLSPYGTYNESSRIPPRDSQTVLWDKTLFEKVGRSTPHGRKVYRRIGTKELWYVDNLHVGADAHIEVFDEVTLEHLGTSKYNEISVNTSSRVSGRKIKLR